MNKKTARLYGLKNCSTCREALKWLEEQGIEASLQDLRETPIPSEVLQTWQDKLGSVLNRRSLAWRAFSQDEKDFFEAGSQEALEVMIQTPTLIKRPIVKVQVEEKGQRNHTFFAGFSSKIKEELFLF